MDILELKDVCRRVRRNIITMTNKAGAGHPGGSLSATEALVALYFDVMKGVDPKDDKNPPVTALSCPRAMRLLVCTAPCASAASSAPKSSTSSVSCTAFCRATPT